MIRNNNDLLTFREASSRLAYDPSTGEIRWRERCGGPRDSSWNTKHAGKLAGTLGSDGYLRLRFNKGGFAAHRIAWLIHFGSWPKEEIDHINGVKSDNRLCNLREADHSLNMSNRCYSASGAKGVSQVGERWRAVIVIGHRKKKNLGYFDTLDEAAAAYRAAECQQ